MTIDKLFVRVVAILGFTLAGLAGAAYFRLPLHESLPFRASVGGVFELTSHDGGRFSSHTLAGKPFAIFFGFTHCPDVCPTTLLDMTQHLKALGEKAERLAVIFVSIDPERDTPEHLKSYLSNFDPRIIGLTGTSTETEAIIKAYRVVVEKVPTSSGYTMNHTAAVFLMDARGRFFGLLNYQEPVDAQLSKLRRLVKNSS